MFENYTFETIASSPRGQWAQHTLIKATQSILSIVCSGITHTLYPTKYVHGFIVPSYAVIWFPMGLYSHRGWGLGAFLRWWSPSTMWAGLLIYLWPPPGMSEQSHLFEFGIMCCMLSTFHVSSQIVANINESSFHRFSQKWQLRVCKWNFRVCKMLLLMKFPMKMKELGWF